MRSPLKKRGARNIDNVQIIEIGPRGLCGVGDSAIRAAGPLELN